MEGLNAKDLVGELVHKTRKEFIKDLINEIDKRIIAYNDVGANEVIDALYELKQTVKNWL